MQFNILFSTHSPFILSDIPTQNTLKLKQGISVSDEDGINSFGANIHYLLADEFFMNDSFIGKFAYDKIAITLNWLKIVTNKLSTLSQNDKYFYDIDSNIEILEFENTTKEHEYHRKIIELIGEPLVKNKLMTMFSKITEDDESMLKYELQKAQKKVLELQKKLNNA